MAFESHKTHQQSFGQRTIASFLEKIYLKTSFQVAFDVVFLALTFEIALVLRLSFGHWVELLPVSLSYLPIIIVIGIPVFWGFGIYRTLWRYASVNSLYLITGASFVAVGGSAIAINYLSPGIFPWSIFIIQWTFLAGVVGTGRMAIRVIRRLTNETNSGAVKNVLIYGAGDGGAMIARDILHSVNHKLRVVGFIDDDSSKVRRSIHGVSVLGSREQVGNYVRDLDIAEIIIAMPSISGSEVRRLLSDLRSQISSRVEILTLPPITQLVEGRATLNQVRQVDVRDLLKREPIDLDLDRVRNVIANRTVLVTGAAGSIGSEICRQVAMCKPAKLVMFDISEAGLYEINETLGGEFPHLTIVPIVGDMARRWQVENLFLLHHPKLVFHAAAYKHVPLMEQNPLAALANNVVGTRVLTEVSAEFNVQRFVMISTDKAVRPTSVMGASKRICEMVVQVQPHKPGTNFCSVRFGNVLGSSGSVVPKFAKQIASGGPITVTDPSVTRYFMLIPEAVQLVLQTATMNGDYMTYYLDMGNPVKIDDLARDMIQLHGLIPGKDIIIEYSGLRPGEKLYEELCHVGDGRPTEIEKIWMTDTPTPNREKFQSELDDLLEECHSMSRKTVYARIARLVPDFVSTNKESATLSTLGSESF